MNTLYQFFNFILHIDHHLLNFVMLHGAWIYALLAGIIFCETAFIITPFLPGDSLLFAAGSIAANTKEQISIHGLFMLLVLASILGNTLNYSIGRYLGPKIFRSSSSWLLNKRHLEEAHDFYLRHGAQTIILARFIPIIRSFAPFVAGAGSMGVKKFMFYNVVSAILWIGSLLYISYLFGNLPFIKNHFSGVILFIIILSFSPPLFSFFKRKIFKNTK